MMARWTFAAWILALAAAHDGRGQEATWQAAFNAGLQHYENGRFAEAEKSLEDAVARAAADSIDLADSWNWLGLSRWKLGKYPEAEAAHHQARPLYQKLRGERSAPFAFSTNNLGLVLWHQGRLKEGDVLLIQALKILEAVEGAKGINVARGLNNTGGLYRSRGFWKKAEPMLLRSSDIWEFRGFPHGDAAHAYSNLARLRQKQGKHAEAVALYTKGLEVSKKKLNAQHPQVGQHLCFLGDALRRQGNLEAAEKTLLEGMRIVEQKLPKEHDSQATGQSYLAELRRAQKEKEEAGSLFEQALAIWAKQAVQPPGAGETHLGYALLCAESGKAELAGKHFQVALAILEKTVGLVSPDLADALDAYANFDTLQAKQLRERSLEIRKRHAEENK